MHVAASSNSRAAALLAALALSALLLALLSSPAAAERAPKMSIKFASPTARLAGPGAMIRVRCAGVIARACIGTLTLRMTGGSAEAPFSIERGEAGTVVVPLASSTARLSQIRNARAVARTMQSRGDSVRTSRLLRIR